MGTIFKYNNQLVQCQNLQKKLKKMRLSLDDIEIIKDDIPNEELEKEFVGMTRISKNTDIEDDLKAHYITYVYKNSKGHYLNCINNNSLEQYTRFGIDVSDYKLIDSYKGLPLSKHNVWNPETKTGRI